MSVPAVPPLSTASAAAAALPSSHPLEEPSVVHEIAAHIRQHEAFYVIGHLRPDGDCFGSCLGLVHVLRGLGKRARFYTDGPMQPTFQYLEGYVDTETTYAPAADETIICVDIAALDRVSKSFAPEGFVINIDHHLSNTEFGNLNWVDVEATAAAEQIYRLALVLGAEITPAMATCLYTGLMTDTGGFRFTNTDQMTFQAASHLVQCGADPAAIARAVFESRKATSIKLQGHVYATLQFENKGRFVWNSVDQATLAQLGCEASEAEGFSSDIRGIEGVEVAVLFVETPEGQLRIGFRSQGEVNVAELAGSLGGGGHRCASGAMIAKPYAEALPQALAACRAYFADKL